ncbi:hypothetical protein C8A01DRAFT_31623 [Parachaetomium inaequale]|uniref:Uncharacterized protein n=1 Tax=Parachaetomium inaequale TaxID=2588326 RepID=A0AAN6PNN4_9PEZI|nr:hypothetical protein C8A01DRAFT_31623 [Parachaetomium inaequale]
MKYLAAFALWPALLLAANSGRSCNPRHSNIHVRYPPTVQPDPSWKAPPYAWLFGHWHPTYTSFEGYLNLWNIGADLYPRWPTTHQEAELRQTLDLTSYNMPPTGNATADAVVYTAFGLDTPAPEIGSAVFNFSGQNSWHLTNYYMLLAWGEDTAGDDYWVQYETPPEIDGVLTPDYVIAIVSRNPNGPSRPTLDAIFDTLNCTFGNEPRGQLSKLAKNLHPTHFDGRRNQSDIPACDEACVQNAWMAAQPH